MVDKKAIETLFFRFWSPQGWTRRHITLEAFEHAKRAGLMFDDVRWTHDEVVWRIRRAAAELDPVSVAEQFAASLSSRRLDLRSALGSYAVGRLIPEHSHTDRDRCPVCGAYGGLLTPDLNILSFERHKWGGVRHLHPQYIAFDLACFLTTEPLAPTGEDLAILDGILDLLQSLPARATPSDAAKALTRVVRSNDAERRALLEILGYCSVLETAEQPGFLQRFVTHEERPAYPPGAKNDWGYPVAWWRGACGVNEEALRFFFPFLSGSGHGREDHLRLL